MSQQRIPPHNREDHHHNSHVLQQYIIWIHPWSSLQLVPVALYLYRIPLDVSLQLFSEVVEQWEGWYIMHQHLSFSYFFLSSLALVDSVVDSVVVVVWHHRFHICPWRMFGIVLQWICLLLVSVYIFTCFCGLLRFLDCHVHCFDEVIFCI